MASYRVCNDCGSHLDPGERCECKEKNPTARECDKVQSLNSFASIQAHYTTKEELMQMREVKPVILSEVSIKNFKGIKDLKLSFSSKESSFHGANASGKTTVIDAIYWLMTGKDSQSRENVEFLPVDQSTGEVIHNLQTVVELTLGNGRVFTRTMAEKWTKKNGAEQAELMGRTTTYIVDGAPIRTQKEFLQYLGQEIDMSTFMITSRPDYFPSLPWQDQRGILLEVSGFDEADIFAKNPSLAWLEGKDVNLEKSSRSNNLKASVTKLNEMAIQEDILSEGIVQGDEEKIVSINRELVQIEQDKQKLMEEAAVMNAGNGRAIIEQKLDNLRQNRVALRTEYNQQAQEVVNRYRHKEYALSHEIDAYNRDIDVANARAEGFENAINGIQRTLEVYRREYLKLMSEKPVVETLCPTCGQELPTEKIEAIKAQANLALAKKLEENVEAGKKMSADIEERMKDKEEALKVADNAKISLMKLDYKAKFFTLESDKQKELENIPPVEEAIAAIGKEIAEQELLLDNLSTGTKVADTTELDARHDKLLSELVTYLTSTKSRNKVAELEASRRTISDNIGKLEQGLADIEEYVHLRAKLISEAVNERFQEVEFKLFDVQVNGGIKETCEVLMHKTPYRNLSNAEKIKAGIHIINTLSGFYGVINPILIDNRESVSHIPATNSQVINFVVDDNYKKLQEA